MTNDWADYRQNRELAELRDQMASVTSEASSLRFRLSQVQGSMETRLGQLTTAFNAFVELSDIRFDLIGFADAAEVRRRAGQVLAALASGEHPPAAGSDVPAYWLWPAVEAIRGLAADRGVDEAMLAEAMKRDERRSSIFLCLALAALGRRNEVRQQWLDTAFGQLAADGTVTRAQRALWTTAARGGFGLEGQNSIVARLKVPSTAATQLWAGHVMTRADKVKVTGPAYREIAGATRARADLSQLRTAVETITGDTSVLEPDRELAYAASEKPDPDSTSAVLRLLISEGSEPEQASLARVAELRRQIVEGAQTDDGAIDDSAGTVDALLQADLANADEPHLAATALRVVATGVAADAETLAQAASMPTPPRVSQEIEWRTVDLLPDGPDRQSLAAAEGAIGSSVQPLSAGDVKGPIAAVVAGVLVAVGLGLTHPFWIIIGILIVAVAGYSYWTAYKKRETELSDAAHRIRRLRDEAGEAAAQFAAYKSEDRDRAAEIATDLQEIKKRLEA
ncbi:hypothetical protein [Kribbella sp. NPDC023855]|uniref:hypothetical protein n=1 Tax=Kribbella sp. NPDC023855 TaxID=3154698 RepID=UPI0033E6A0E1